MPKKLNDTQIAELVYKHANGTSISTLAKEYHLNWETVKRYINDNRELREKSEAIKNETILEWITNNSNELAGLLDDIKANLRDKIKDASVRELFGGLKILTDLGINLKTEKPQGDQKQDEITLEFVDTRGDVDNG